VSVDLAQLFKDLQVQNAVELTLTGNRPKSEEKRLQWKTATDAEQETRTSAPLAGTVVELAPMEIRTFVVQLLQR